MGAIVGKDGSTFPVRLGAVALLLATALAAAVAPTPAPAAARPTTVRWGYYITYDATSLASLRAQVGQLDIVSPYFYHLKADGTIEDFSQAEALAVMRKAGVAIVPMIKNVPRWDDFHNTMATPEQRDAIVERIVDLVTRNNYDGIHIDFEAVNGSDAALLTDFQQRLANRLRPLGKLVTQAIAARTSDAPTAWGGAYDYAALGAVNDFVVVMAYDYHYAGGNPGPVAPLPWVRQVVSYTKSRIPADRILLGMPLYGYNWNVTEQQTATSVRFDQAQTLLARPGATGGYDVDQAAAWIRYTDDAGHQHEVWYENAASLRAKLDVMLDQGVGGFALWRLGHEDPAVWTEVARLATPATRIPAFPSTAERAYFAVTGHSLAFGFKRYWERSGGLPVFGYPLTEEFNEPNPDTGQTYTVQYFERQRYEYHPEYAGTPYEVLLGRLGVASAQRSGLLATEHFRPLPASTQPDANCDFFPETGHRLCFGFRDYWRTHGVEFGDRGVSFRESLALFGYPISEEFPDPVTGRTVQYFERARFEYHPENAGTPYTVLLGLLGTDEVRAKGWIR
ncbi:MAG: glycosyl hydrolase family 18 protein [Sphaerobacter sp.]|nr:glycosyl hydrolase family 18 protein [Sphaerobacter sp.]